MCKCNDENDPLDDDLECYWNNSGDIIYYDCEDDLYYTYNPETEQWYGEHGDSDEPSPIDRPKKPWVDRVLNWATEHNQDRQLIMDSSKWLYEVNKS